MDRRVWNCLICGVGRHCLGEFVAMRKILFRGAEAALGAVLDEEDGASLPALGGGHDESAVGVGAERRKDDWVRDDSEGGSSCSRIIPSPLWGG